MDKLSQWVTFIWQYSNMAPRLSGQTSIFGVVFFVSKFLLGIERQDKREKLAIFTRKPGSHVRILIYRTWFIRDITYHLLLGSLRNHDDDGNKNPTNLHI